MDANQSKAWISRKSHKKMSFQFSPLDESQPMAFSQVFELEAQALPGSSAVERSAVNRLVAGSIPARAAISPHLEPRKRIVLEEPWQGLGWVSQRAQTSPSRFCERSFVPREHLW